MSTKNAYGRIWIIKRLVTLGASRETLIDTYIKQVRTVLEYGVPVWHSSLTLQQKSQIERVQNTSMKVILGQEYQSADTARKVLKLNTLEKRRIEICMKFGQKATLNKNHSKWFKKNTPKYLNLRKKETVYKVPFCRTKRFENSTIPYITRLLTEVTSRVRNGEQLGQVKCFRKTQ